MRVIIFAGLVFFIGSIILIVSNYDKYEVERNGIIVKVKIERLPTSCTGSKVPYFVTYSYKGKLYDKQTRGNYCEIHNVGDFVDMKVLNGSNYLLFPQESALFDLVSFGILGLFGLSLSIFQWKKFQKTGNIGMPL